MHVNPSNPDRRRLRERRLLGAAAVLAGVSVAAVATFVTAENRSPAASPPVDDSDGGETHTSTRQVFDSSGPSPQSERDRVHAKLDRFDVPTAPSVVPELALAPDRNAESEETFVRRGRIEVEGGGPPPDDWRLEVTRPAGSAWRTGTPPVESLTKPSPEFDFEVRLTRGRWVLRATAPAYSSRSLDVTVGGPEPSDLGELVLIPAGPVEGSLVDAQGAPLVDVPVHLVPVDGPKGSRASSPLAWTVDAIRTDDTGLFRFPAVGDGTYDLGFGWLLPAPGTPPSFATRIEVLAPATRLYPVVAPPSATLSIAVRDERDVGIAEAVVRVLGPRGATLVLRADPYGSCLVPWLPVGRYRVFASAEGFGRGNASVEVREATTYDCKIRLAG